MSVARRCFVISPIGQPGSAVRERADMVLDSIISPALTELRVEAVRADKIKETGSITDQMLQAILEYGFCIADVTGHNPNVFYELALAQAAERPVIIIKEVGGEKVPFDINDWRHMEYDLALKANAASALKTLAKEVLQAGYRAPKLLHGRSWSTSGVRAYLLDARGDLGDAPRYLDVVEEAKGYCDVMGVALPAWRSEDARKALRSLDQRRVPTRILVMDEAHPGLEVIMNAGLPSEGADGLRRTTAAVMKMFAEIQQTAASLEVRRLRRGMPHFQLVMTERIALVVQYLCSRSTEGSPLQAYSSKTELHEVFLAEFNQLWDANAP